MNFELVPASTSQSLYFYVEGDNDRDPPGEGVAGLVAADFTIGYIRQGAALTSISLSDLAAIDSAFSSGGIKSVGGRLYRLDVPNAALIAGVKLVEFDVVVAAAQNAVSSGITVTLKEVSVIAAPSAPTISVTATTSTPSVILVATFTANAASFDWYRAPSSGGSFTILAAGTAVAALTFTDSTVVSGTTYYYKAKAKNSTGDSSFSNEVSGAGGPAAVATLGNGNYWEINLGRGLMSKDIKIEITTGTYEFTLRRADLKGFIT